MSAILYEQMSRQMLLEKCLDFARIFYTKFINVQREKCLKPKKNYKIIVFDTTYSTKILFKKVLNISSEIVRLF